MINDLPLYYDTTRLADDTFYTILHGGESGAYYSMFATTDELPTDEDIVVIKVIATTLDQ